MTTYITYTLTKYLYHWYIISSGSTLTFVAPPGSWRLKKVNNAMNIWEAWRLVCNNTVVLVTVQTSLPRGSIDLEVHIKIYIDVIKSILLLASICLQSEAPSGMDDVCTKSKYKQKISIQRHWTLNINKLWIQIKLNKQGKTLIWSKLWLSIMHLLSQSVSCRGLFPYNQSTENADQSSHVFGLSNTG